MFKRIIIALCTLAVLSTSAIARVNLNLGIEIPAPLRCQLTVSTQTSGGGTMVIKASSP